MGTKFNRKGYFLNENKDKFILGDDVEDKSSTHKNDKTHKPDKVEMEITSDVLEKKGDREDKSFIEKINSLEEKLNEVYQWFSQEKEKNNEEEASFKTDITIPEGDLVKKSIRINKNVWELFDRFCDKYYKKHTKQELLAYALLEYLKNHN